MGSAVQPESVPAHHVAPPMVIDDVFRRRSWEESPLPAYQAWLRSRTIGDRPYAAKTIEQYGTMFGAFLRWLQSATDHSLLDVTQDQLSDFAQSLSGRDADAASIRTKRIYLMEIARALDFLCSQGWRSDNPARDLVQQIKRQEPMKFRNSALVGQPVRANYLRALDALDATNLPWDEVRIHTMALLMLELGLTLKEVQKLTLQDVAAIEQGWLHAPGHRTLRGRTLAAPAVVRDWMRAWLAHRDGFTVYVARVRRRRGANGGAEPLSRTPDNRVCAPSVARVFVSLLSPRGAADEQGRRLATNRADDRLIRQAATTALRLAAPDWPLGIVHGPQMLRNLCFQRCVLQHPEDHDLVVQMMGLSDSQQVRWMARLLGLPQA